MEKQTFGEWLGHMMKIMQISPKDIRVITGLSPASTSRILQDKQTPSIETLRQLAVVLGISLFEIQIRAGYDIDVPAELSGDELVLIALFRKLNDANQAALVSIGQVMFKNQ